ncbi:MAG: DUF3488 and transglutaminase-like domain-containing protein [Chloroflexi bacterium]|nr:DUF3488 and transglutaminase-like domain-containing protein [Chloroflexota bacterium]MCL5276134.1 DUF3488 and transglutaminase-like domain-containing protein [Chloroflexota bacterium]
MKRTDLFTLLVLFVMLGAAVSAISAAEWLPGLGVAAWAMGLGLLAGAALAFSNFTDWMAHVTSLIYGLFVVMVIGGTHSSIPQSMEWRDRFYLIVDKIVGWVRQAASNGASRESIIFVLILCGLFWLLGYTAAWYSFRYRRIWHIILPTGVTLFSSVYYYAGAKPMTSYLVIYLVCALILLVESHLADREEGWLRDHVRFVKGLRTSFTMAGIGIAAVALFFAWRAPEIAASETAHGVFNQLNNPFSELLARWNRLFSTLQNNNQIPVDNYTSSLVLGGPRNLTADPVMDVTAPPMRYYWRASTFDSYDGAAWSNTFSQSRDLAAQDHSFKSPAYQQRADITATFVMYRGANSIFAPSLPQSANVPSQAIYATTDDGSIELMQLKLPSPLLPGNRYSAEGSLTMADAAQLRTAAKTYPAWIRSKYLQLPGNIPQRVRQLAGNIAGRETNDYDKAAAIERWLRANITYDEQLAAPPPGVEASDYILFRTKRAYCNYYATAMVVMLRSLGVASRIATGYAQGQVTSTAADMSSAVYSVKVKDSHTWVEVFFPGYGWVEFEPTAGQPALQRSDSAQVAGAPTPVAPTPTPLPLTPVATVQPTVLPNDTPGATSGTSVPQQVLDGLSKLLAFVLKLLPFALIIVVVVVAGMAALRVAEEAGFGHLPPVQRAYAMLSRWATWLGIGQEHTPYEQASELSQRVPASTTEAQSITRLYVQNRFGAAAPDAQQEQTAYSAWSKARRELRRTWLRRKLRSLFRR